MESIEDFLAHAREPIVSELVLTTRDGQRLEVSRKGGKWLGGYSGPSGPAGAVSLLVPGLPTQADALALVEDGLRRQKAKTGFFVRGPLPKPTGTNPLSHIAAEYAERWGGPMKWQENRNGCWVAHYGPLFLFIERRGGGLAWSISTEDTETLLAEDWEAMNFDWESVAMIVADAVPEALYAYGLLTKDRLDALERNAIAYVSGSKPD